MQGWPNAAPGAASSLFVHFWWPLRYIFLEHNAVNALESGVDKCQREASMCMRKEDIMQVCDPSYLRGHKKRPP